MIELMDQNGRIIRVRAEYYPIGGEAGLAPLSADEAVLEMLKQAPVKYLRGPSLAPERR